MPLHEPLNPSVREALRAFDDLTAGLLARRGITSHEEAEKFLNPSYEEHLHDPLLMTDMEKAARRFADAIVCGEKIVVWSDYDCDGVPGAVLLHDFLKKVGADFENYIPHRHLEGYGVNVAGIEKLAKEGVSLVVTVDSGITDHEAVARANELGLTVIVTDHHLPKETLPPAFAVLNPNARSDETYPFKHLCGSGVAWKLVCSVLAVDPRLRERVGAGWEKWLLDMVALATVADMVPLVGENRVLVHYGLKVLRKSPRVGLRELLRVARAEQRALSEDDIGFSIAPRVNAASRMGDAIDAFKLLTTESSLEAETLAKKLEKANRSRKAEAGAVTRAAHEKLRARGAISPVIVLGDPEWRPALLGLVANTIAEEYERPVFLWGREGNMTLKGSVRSGGVVHVLHLMEAARDAFIEFGGHRAAGGFSVKDAEIFSLEEKLVAALATLGGDETREAELADAPLSLERAHPHTLTSLERLAPFGIDNPKPVFLFTSVTVREVSRFGKNKEHLKLALTDTITGVEKSAIAFYPGAQLTRAVTQLKSGEEAHILAHLERDTFSRGQPVRLRLVDIKVA